MIYVYAEDVHKSIITFALFKLLENLFKKNFFYFIIAIFNLCIICNIYVFYIIIEYHYS